MWNKGFDALFGWLGPGKHKNAPPMPDPMQWEFGTPEQKSRAARSFAELGRRCVPVYPGPLMVEAEADIRLQKSAAVARRALILYAVTLRADGADRADAMQIVHLRDLWEHVSPKEKAFLDPAEPSAEDKFNFLWRLEALWVLMWALGKFEKLSWPATMCNVPKLTKLMLSCADETHFIKQARLRPAAEILDAQDLIMRIHWAVRDAFLRHGGRLPGDLDWSKSTPHVTVSQTPAVGVVEQRHYALNWLVNFLEPASWDDVDTPT